MHTKKRTMNGPLKISRGRPQTDPNGIKAASAETKREPKLSRSDEKIYEDNPANQNARPSPPTSVQSNKQANN